MKRRMMTAGIIVSSSALGAVLLALMGAAPPAPPQALPDLEKSLVEEATAARKMAEQAYRSGNAAQSEVSKWTARETEAKLAMATDKAQRIALLTALVDQARQNETVVTMQLRAGLTQPIDAHAAKYDLIQAEIRVAKAQQE
jgi:hypothetical protein